MPPTPLPDLLDELLRTYGPCGEEAAVRDVVRRELEPLADEVSVDPAGNLVALMHGTDRSVPAVRVMAHLDELSMMVKRIDPTARCGSPRRRPGRPAGPRRRAPPA